MSGSWACLAWGVYRHCLAVKMLGGWANGICGVLLGFAGFVRLPGCLVVGRTVLAGSVLVAGARGEGLKAWVVKLLGGLSASAVHKEL